MTEDLIGYNDIINKSMIGVVIDVLKKIKKNNGLPGEHHIYLTFLTNENGVTISRNLKNKFKDEMTIVLQHQFGELEVKSEYFSVILHFDNKPEKIVIPYSAMTKFFDPAVNFGIDFMLKSQQENTVDKQNQQLANENLSSVNEKHEKIEKYGKTAEVVSLKEFKKETNR
ncbi:ClpXP protease specificity-enhancing factor SspB [Gammaproteobacteria bacterium]|nr:ClpXP protease specificity-enhancing factor SspB [Gammaproteobacteria bacterium]|tara:strand:- start:7006 stop:7515 length:510 start_codon:yes stop_codon:yes gene_type:complete